MYYFLNPSMNPRIVGKYCQSENIANNELRNNPRFLNNVYFTEVDFEPITPKAILHKKAKLTDLISNVNAGGSLRPLMSEKLRDILVTHRATGMQFFSSSLVTANGHEIEGYCSLNMHQSNNEFIDIKNSLVRHQRKSTDYEKTYKTEVEYRTFNDYNSFANALGLARENGETFYIEKLKLLPGITEEFFMVEDVDGGVNFIVSENLRKELETACCIGIEFQPVELSQLEWLQGGEREKVYGKS